MQDIEAPCKRNIYSARHKDTMVDMDSQCKRNIYIARHRYYRGTMQELDIHVLKGVETQCNDIEAQIKRKRYNMWIQ
jgi:hypothetical protein